MVEEDRVRGGEVGLKNVTIFINKVLPPLAERDIPTTIRDRLSSPLEREIWRGLIDRIREAMVGGS